MVKGLTANYLYLNFLHYRISIGYVQEMKKLCFAITKEKDMSQLKAVYEKYSANAPDSLSSQFPDRVNKPEAVQHHIERTQKETSKCDLPRENMQLGLTVQTGKTKRETNGKETLRESVLTL